MSTTSTSSNSSHSSLASPSGSSSPTSILRSPDSSRSDKKVRFSDSNDYFIFTTPEKERERRPKSISPSPSEYSLKCLLAGQQVLATPGNARRSKIPKTQVKSLSAESNIDFSHRWCGKEEECNDHSGVEKGMKERERHGAPTLSRFSSFSMINAFDHMVDFFTGVKRTGKDESRGEDMNEYKIITRRRLFRPTTYSIVFYDNARKSV
ncbi:hypothetical protein I302_107151 [Kwoniella bestiolae CBS 10118]|uniref:Uncharacterized protein n=1 Tax=Kwoniella bestiolae CBS 10118 TaxID=1296100 RepID=A0A1B9FZC9_9TREE|nr:hypothetical protein I302_05582 [Kwoniella bestiolae CBS 10118]OCF24124.1 hypothetical protein I302_05582 [Kwoniella bestiolae CBS 10118]